MNIKDIEGPEEIAFVGRRKPCVYFLVDNSGEVLYVGKSSYVGTRIGEHLQSQEFTRLFVWELETDEEALQKEAELIWQLKPPRNRMVDGARVGIISLYGLQKIAKERGIKVTSRQIENILWAEGFDPETFCKRKIYYSRDKALAVLEK